MTSNASGDSVSADLTVLCGDINDRHVGSPGNLQATRHVGQRLEAAGFAVTEQWFDCMDWEFGAASLQVDGTDVPANVSPYSLPAAVAADMAVACTQRELAELDLEGRIVALGGELAREQIMPKNFPFYNPDRHRRVVSLLEMKRPAAIVAVTGRDPGLAGGQYPFPLFEDGDLDIPSVYVAEEFGHLILGRTGCAASLFVDSRRIPATACNVIGRRAGSSGRRLVLCAHVDGKKGMPAAIDNASGVACLLAVADLLVGFDGHLGLELLFTNGEDYYAASGQLAYLADHRPMDVVVLAVNVDGVGLFGGRTGVSTFGVPRWLDPAVSEAFGDQKRYGWAGPWYQGDHMLFVNSGVPAIALTAEDMDRALALAHSPRGTVHGRSDDRMRARSPSIRARPHAETIVLGVDRGLRCQHQDHADRGNDQSGRVPSDRGARDPQVHPQEPQPHQGNGGDAPASR